MFRATVCPSSGEITIYVTLSGIPDGRPHRITSTKCRINTFVSPDDGRIVARNMQRKEISILRKTVHQVDFIYKIIQGCAVNKT